MPESCYFYVDGTLPPEQQRMQPMCLDCHNKLESKVGSYWDGSLGYGPFDFICGVCDKVIHKGSTGTDEET